jgi:hypothetical protein
MQSARTAIDALGSRPQFTGTCQKDTPSAVLCHIDFSSDTIDPFLYTAHSQYIQGNNHDAPDIIIPLCDLVNVGATAGDNDQCSCGASFVNGKSMD